MKPHRITCKDIWGESYRRSNSDKEINLTYDTMGKSNPNNDENCLMESYKTSGYIKTRSTSRSRSLSKSPSYLSRVSLDETTDSKPSRNSRSFPGSYVSSGSSIALRTSHKNRKTTNWRNRSKSVSRKSKSSKSIKHRSYKTREIDKRKKRSNVHEKSHDRPRSRSSHHTHDWSSRETSRSSQSSDLRSQIASYRAKQAHQYAQDQSYSRNNLKDVRDHFSSSQYGLKNKLKIDREQKKSPVSRSLIRMSSRDRSRSEERYHRETTRSSQSSNSGSQSTSHIVRVARQHTQDKSYPRHRWSGKGLRNAISSKKFQSGKYNFANDLRGRLNKFNQNQSKTDLRQQLMKKQPHNQHDDLRYSINNSNNNPEKIINEWGKRPVNKDYYADSFCDGMFRCDVCDVSVATQHEMQIHMDGKSHRKKCGEVERFSCKLCMVEVTCQATLDSHLMSKRHLKRVRNKKEKMKWQRKEEREVRYDNYEGDITAREKEEVAMLKAQVSHLQKKAKSLQMFSQHCNSNHGTKEYKKFLKYKERCRDQHIRSKIVSKSISIGEWKDGYWKGMDVKNERETNKMNYTHSSDADDAYNPPQ